METILNNIVLVVLNISLWGGRKKLRPEDLAANGIDIDRLPPGTLASLGSKRIISPSAVNVFVNLKKEAERLCLQYGVRLIGGYAVPDDKVDDLTKELATIKTQFEAARANFISDYDNEVASWIASNPPEWASIIKAAVDPVNHLHRTISFNYAAVAITAPAHIEENGLEEEVGGLYGQLCHEVRQAAKLAYEQSFVGRSEITRKALRPIRTIREKLAGMAFLDGSLVDTIQAIDDTLSKIPKNGPIKGTDLNMVAGLVGRQLANMGRVMPIEIEEITVDEPETVPDEILLAIEAPVQETEIAPLAWDF